MRKSLALFFLLSFAFNKLSAGETLAQRRLSFQGEYLHLFPMISQSYYLQRRAPSGLFPFGNRTNNDVGFRPAYRVIGNYSFCNCFTDLKVRWTQLPHMVTTDSKAQLSLNVQGPPILTGNSIINGASKIRLDYCAADATYGFWFFQTRCIDLFFRTGLHFANIKFKESVTYLTIVASRFLIENHSKLFGVGPELDLDARYTLPCQDKNKLAFSLFSSLRGAFLAARYHAINRSRLIGTSTTTILADDSKRWDLVRFWDVRAGINYKHEFECFCASIEAGYELFSYKNAIDRIFFSNFISTGTSLDVYSDVNFQGPFIALKLTF